MALRFLVAVMMLAAASGSHTSAAAQQRAVPTLRVVEPSGALRRQWPMSAGVPLPAGMVRDAGELSLLDGSSAIGVQGRTLSRWPDGSVRWAMLEWAADLEPGQERMWRVERRRVTAATPLSVKEDAERIAVDTGALRFTVPRRGSSWITDLQLGGSKTAWGPLSAFVEVGDRRFGAQPPTRVEIVERGPWRARIELRGSYGGGLHYLLRIDAFARQPVLRILHTFEQRSASTTSVRRISLDLRGHLAGGAAYAAERDGAPRLFGDVGDGGVRIYQEDNRTLRLGTQAQSARASGWFDLHDAQHGVALQARYFWQEYPQSIELRRDGLTYNLWAPEAQPAAIGMGAAKTHEWALLFHPAGAADPRLLATASLPLHAHTDAVWTASSGAARGALAPLEENQSFLRELAAAYARYRQHADRETWDDRGTVDCPRPHGAQATPKDDPHERPRVGLYGMLHWGDWNFPGYHDDTKGCDAWGNLEYDTAQVLALGYLASGDRRYFDSMVAAARHFMDVDTIHYQADEPSWVGMNHPKNPLHFSFALGGVDLGHTWTEGLLSYYYLTGDERGLDAARGIADYLVHRTRSGPRQGNPRQFGWPQIALVAVYEASGEARYKDAARHYADLGMGLHPPDKLRDFKIGILAEALAYTHSVSPEAAIQSWLTSYGRAVAALPGTPDARLLPALAYLGRTTANPDLTAKARAAVPNLRFGNWGKPFTIAGRLGFSILSGVR